MGLKYYSLFKKALNNNFDLKECLPAKEQIEKILKALYNAGHFYEFDGISVSLDKHFITVVVRNLIETFKVLIQENKLEDIDQAIDFLINIHAEGLDFNEYIESIIYKETKFEDEETYYDCIKQFCHYVNVRYDGLCNESRIAKTIDVYRRIHESLPIGTNNSPEWNNRIFFEKYAPYIVGHFYKTDLDPVVLENILNKFTNNISILLAKGILNGICDLSNYRSSEGFIGEYNFTKSIFENRMDNKKTIK